MDQHHRIWIRRSMRIVLLLLACFAAWIIMENGGSWLDQIEAFSWQLRWHMLVISALILVLTYYIIPLGWIWLARAAGSEVSTNELRSAWFLSQLGRYVPGKVWLFAGRAGFLRSRGLSTIRSTSVPFLELLYTAAGAGLAAVVPALISSDFAIEYSGLRSAIIAAGACVLIIPLLRPIQRLLYRIKHGAVPEALPLPGIVGSMKLLLLYCGLWWMRGLALYLWLSGFGLPNISFWICCAAAPLSWLAGYIVFLVPGGVGVREAATVALVAGPGDTGPVLAVVAGQRIVLSLIEVLFAAATTGRGILFRREKKD